MRIAWMSVVLLGCSSKAAVECPTGEAIAKAAGSEIEVAEAKVVSAQCASDHWAARDVVCVRDAKSADALEKCFDALPAAQGRALKEALSRADAPAAVADQAAFMDGVIKDLDAKLAPSDAVFTSSSECGHYRAEIKGLFFMMTKCPDLDHLEIYGMQQNILADVKLLAATAPADLPAACAKAEAIVTKQPIASCKLTP